MSAKSAHEHRFSMPAHNSHYINPEFKKILEKYGMRGIESSGRALTKVEGYDIKDGTLGDLGEMYHKAFGQAQMSLYLQNGSTQGNKIMTACLAKKRVLIQSNSHISMHVGL